MYAEQVKTMRADGKCTTTSFGQCGKLRVTHFSAAPWAETLYFDKSGKLIVARVETDLTLFPGCPDWIHYGDRISCEVTKTKPCKPL